MQMTARNVREDAAAWLLELMGIASRRTVQKETSCGNWARVGPVGDNSVVYCTAHDCSVFV